MSHRLDRDKPLWEAWVIEGLPDGRWAMLSKLHHCMADGVSGTDLLAVVLDLSAIAELPPPEPWQPAHAPSALHLAASAIGRQLTEPVRIAPSLVAAARSPRATVEAARRFSRGVVQYVADVVPTQPTSLSGAAGMHRRWRTTSVPLDDVRAVRKALGGTVNDVALAAVTNGFRDLMTFRSEQPGPRSVRTLVPVSTREPGQESIRDNRVSAMLVDLPVHLADPVDQLRAVQLALARHKATGEAAAGDQVTRAARHLPFELVGPVLRAAFRLPQQYLTTVTTNVPGPPFPLYAFGRPMLEAYPYVPIGDRLRIGIAMFSYCGRLSFGVTSDAATTPDADVLVEGIERGVAALLARASAPSHEFTHLGAVVTPASP
jgi:diacylglycerol O-acyltransferase